MKIINQSLLYTNIFVAFIASIASFASAFLFHLNITSNFYYFIFSATLASYSLHWYFTPNSFDDDDERAKWSVANKKILIGLLLMASSAGIYFFTKFNTMQQMYILPLAILSFIYTAPKIPFAPLMVLRKHTYLKTLYLAFCWTYATVYLPFIFGNTAFVSTQKYYILHRFGLMLCVCILFDHRDKHQDMLGGIKSILNMLGSSIVPFFVRLAASLSILGWLHSFEGMNNFYWALNLLPVLLIIAFTKKIMASKNDTLYYGFLDGLVLINGLLLLVFSII